MRYVYPSQDVVKLWMTHRTPGLRSPGNRVFANDDRTLYSYGQHFPLAHYTPRGGGVLLLNDSRYSMTTAKHQCWARLYARTAYSTIYSVPDSVIQDFVYDAARVDFSEMLDELRETAGKWHRARRDWSRDRHASRFRELLTAVNDLSRINGQEPPEIVVPVISGLPQFESAQQLITFMDVYAKLVA